MEEKKLNDEEIVKALECCSKSWACNNCKRDKENNNRFICSENLLKDCLDLINRKKAEIERLTEYNANLNGMCLEFTDKNAELQKQVDELKKSQANKYALEAVYNNGYEQAVKDTAKEILQEGKYCLSKSLQEWIKERYGVSYEENN